MVKKRYRYYAFISYQSKDREWARWLHGKLENFHLPATIARRRMPDKGFRPLFLDEVELAGGNLSAKINKALEDSRYLIVICSTNSAKSEWVDKEVKIFIDSGRIDKILPIIIDGTPYAERAVQECFVPALRSLKGTKDEILGINAQGSKDIAFIKIAAELLNVSFDTLWQRHEKEKEQERQRLIDEKRRLQRVESRYLSEKSIQLLKDGYSRLSRRLALEALPVDLGDPEDRPYVPEAEVALRAENPTNVHRIDLPAESEFVAVSPNGRYVAAILEDYRTMIWNSRTGIPIGDYENDPWAFNFISFSHDSRHLITCDDGGIVTILSVRNLSVASQISTGVSLVSAYLSRDAEMLWTFDVNHRLCLWDMHSGECISRIYRREDDRMDLGDACPLGASVSSINKGWTYFAYITYRRDAVCVVNLETKDIYRKNISDMRHLAFNPSDTDLSYAERVVCNQTEIADYLDPFEVYFMPKEFSSPIVAMCYDRNNNIYYALESGEIHITVSRLKRKAIINDSVATQVASMSVNSDGSLLAAVQGRELRIWDRNNVPESIVIKDIIHEYEFSPDSNSITTYGSGITARRFTRIDLNGMEVHKILRNIPADHIGSVSFLSDGTIFYRHKDHIIRADSITGKEQYVHKTTSADWLLNIQGIHATADSQKICYNDSCCVYVHDVVSATTRRLRIPDNISKAQLCCDGSRLLVLTSSGLYLWNIKTNTPSRVLASDQMISSFDVSPDGKTVAVAMPDYSIRIVNVADGSVLSCLEGNTGDINSVSFSSDGLYVISSSGDAMIRIWHKMYKNPLWTIRSRHATTDARFSPDMKKIAYLSDGRLVVREFPALQELIDRNRELYMKEPLTRQERIQYYID